MSEKTLGVAIHTGYENDPLLAGVNKEFSNFVLGTLQKRFRKREVFAVGERPAEAPETPEEELLVERHRLQDIENNADVVAMLLNGNPPDARAAILGGFAVGNRIPIAAMRTSPGRTGEDGLSFNLMLHAAIEESRGHGNEPFDVPLHLAKTYKEFAGELLDAARRARILNWQRPELGPDTQADQTDETYVASPYGFAESTFESFYKPLYLAALRRHEKILCPLEAGQADAEEVLSLPEELRVLRARSFVQLIGVNNIGRVLWANKVMAGVDQEPPDVGTLVEVGIAAAAHKPVTLYRSDLRTYSLGEKAKFDAGIQAAASLYLPEEEAVARLDKFATNLSELERQLAQTRHRPSDEYLEDFRS